MKLDPATIGISAERLMPTDAWAQSANERS